MTDLTRNEVQGSYGNDIIKELQTPGDYKLKFKYPLYSEIDDEFDDYYESEDYDGYHEEVKITRVEFSRGGAFQLIQLDDGRWFYYNGSEGLWKPIDDVAVEDELRDNY